MPNSQKLIEVAQMLETWNGLSTARSADVILKELGPIITAAQEALKDTNPHTDAKILGLAQDARPSTEEDWGSERQLDAELMFWDACRDQMPVAFHENPAFVEYCLKATTDEQIDRALEILGLK